MNNSIFFSLYSLAHQSKFLDWLIVFCANTFGYIMIVVAIIFLFFHTDGVFDYHKPFLQLKNKFKEISFIFFSGIFAWVVAEILKSFIVSPRPFVLFQNVTPLFVYGGLDSFPSGHAMFFSALAVSLYSVHKKIGWVYIVVALIIGLARIISGVHFPVDILTGYILGSAIALIFKHIFIKINKR